MNTDKSIQRHKLRLKNLLGAMLIATIVYAGFYIYYHFFYTDYHVFLEQIQVESTFPQADQDMFTKQLETIENKDRGSTGMAYIDAVERARYHEYLGYPGRAIIIYEDFLDEYGGEYYAITNNLGKLYLKICEMTDDITMHYCDKALDHFNKMIDRHKTVTYYKDISIIYLKMNEIDKAKQYYYLYTAKTKARESRLEKKLGIQ